MGTEVNGVIGTCDAADGNPYPPWPSYTRIMNPFAAERCTVMGLGRFGGGLGVTRWLLDQGCTVCVTDLAEAGELADSLAPLTDDIEAGRVRLQLSRHEQSDFTDTDLVIANPAVPRPWDNTCLQAARNRGVPISTEIRLLVERLDRSRIIGVTGTNGKSTDDSDDSPHPDPVRFGCQAWWEHWRKPAVDNQ